jgi:AcrR family transcriptional regulator
LGEGVNTSANDDSQAQGQRADDGPSNRERVLEAAARVFAEQGLGASVPAIASAAGVGVGTIYRTFDSKHELIGAVVADRIDWHAHEAEKALAGDGDPFESLMSLLWRTAERQARDYVTAEGLTATYDLPAVHAARERAGVAIIELFKRAQEQPGGLRKDFSPADLGMFFTALAGAQHSVGHGSEAWKRLMGILEDGLRADNATSELPVQPLSVEELERAAEEERARQDF